MQLKDLTCASGSKFVDIADIGYRRPKQFRGQCANPPIAAFADFGHLCFFPLKLLAGCTRLLPKERRLETCSI